MAPTGGDIERIVPLDWTNANPVYSYTGFSHQLSPDREKNRLYVLEIG